MSGIDEALAGLGQGAGLGVALVVAILLGLRHATDPDHLTAVATLTLAEDGHGLRRAGRLGLAWGFGHATTLLALGVPVLLLHGHLPSLVHRAAELAVGCLVALLALRLLVRWRRGYFHLHPHRHGTVVHAHPHVHEHGRRAAHPEPHEHDHAHPEQLGRTPREAFGIGMVHGVAGSAGIGILLVGAASRGAAAATALAVFALAVAISMALVSAVLGSALAQATVRRRVLRLVPVLGSAALAFGAWYAAAVVYAG